MAHDNVELARRTFDALNRRDAEAVLERMHEDVVAFPLVSAVEGGYHGLDGIRLWWEHLVGGFGHFTVVVLDVRALGDRTLAQLHFHGSGAGSEAPFELDVWYLTEWRDGKALSWHAYRTEAEALAAAQSSG